MKQKINKEAYERLVIEHKELREKMDKLGGFIDTDKFYSLEVNQQCLLRSQYGSMSSFFGLYKQDLIR